LNFSAEGAGQRSEMNRIWLIIFLSYLFREE